MCNRNGASFFGQQEQQWADSELRLQKVLPTCILSYEGKPRLAS